MQPWARCFAKDFAAIDDGANEPRVVGGAFAEAGAPITGADDPDAARDAAARLVLEWMSALRPLRRESRARPV